MGTHYLANGFLDILKERSLHFALIFPKIKMVFKIESPMFEAGAVCLNNCILMPQNYFVQEPVTSLLDRTR